MCCNKEYSFLFFRDTHYTQLLFRERQMTLHFISSRSYNRDREKKSLFLWCLRGRKRKRRRGLTPYRSFSLFKVLGTHKKRHFPHTPRNKERKIILFLHFFFAITHLKRSKEEGRKRRNLPLFIFFVLLLGLIITFIVLVIISFQEISGNTGRTDGGTIKPR